MSFLKKVAMGILLLTLVLGLFGCVSKNAYETLQNETDNLKQENTLLAGAKSELESNLEKTQSDLASLQKENEKTKSDLSALQADYDAAVAEKEGLVEDLGAMEAVYPPKEFSSLSELRNWLLQNDVSEKPVTETAELWYSVALELQKDALNDGYIISVDYDSNEDRDTWWVWCTTIINGDIWYWDPEEDEPYQEEDLGPVE